jgi:hypothetical protein
MNFIFLLIALVVTYPSNENGLLPLAAADARIPDHSIWSMELDKYVSDEGLIDYKEWKAHQDNLDKYLQQLSLPLPLSNWSQNVQLAYWINLYNAYTVKLVLQHYPIQSVNDIFDGHPRHHAWITLGENQYSLENIELEIRKQFNDPRVHFALNQAIKSSPPQIREAYIPDRLSEQLDAQTECFIRNTAYNHFTDTAAVLSPLFEVYKSDFKPSLPDFLKKYLPENNLDHVSIKYFEMDWTLNAQPTK